MSKLTLRSAARTPQTNASGAPADTLQPLRFGLRFELAVFLLLVATFAAVLFKDSIVDHRFTIDASNIGSFNRYWYADDTSGGKSTTNGSIADPLHWACELRTGFAYRFCGSGILFDINHDGTGRDLSRFDKIVVDLDYQGPARQLKIALKNSDRRYANPQAGDTTKPNVLTVSVLPGRNRLVLNPADFAVEPWWAAAHKTLPDADKPQIDNVVAIDLQTAESPPLGHYDFRLREIALSGASVTPEHWYLVLLGVWTGVAALYLAYRVVRMKHAFTARQRHLFAESQGHAEARDAAESASQAKSRFLAHMSHELRTPLNAILGYAQILKASALTYRQNKAANTIQQSGEHLLALITDILDLSRIEAGKLELVPHPIDIRRTIRAVTDMMAVRAQEKDIVFHETVAADVPRGVVGDDKCLRQVLINLAGNAVKFTDHGEVRLLVTSVAAAGGDVRLRFEVRDTGPGIAPDQVQAIFEPFEQVGDRSRRAGGTGLGLSISRRIVDLMGGELRVESTPGVGSRFWFELELPLADTNALPKTGEIETEAVMPLLERVVVDAVPSTAAMERLHRAAKAGNMRSVRAYAERLAQEEPHTQAFAKEVLGLARAYQSRALLEFIEHHKQESATV
jgi:signal transduction histidine kinase